MIDLTPLEVRKKKGDFKRAMRGYEPGAVDDFIELVADRLEELVRANLTHTDRLRQLEQQVRDYQERERALTEALVSAQELREEMREQALREADLSRRTAEQDVERIRADALRQLEQEAQNLRRLRARQAQFVQTYRTMLERELEELAVTADTIGYRRSAEAEVVREAEAEVVREADVDAARKPEVEAARKPEAEATRKPEAEATRKPEAKPEAEPIQDAEPVRLPEPARIREPEGVVQDVALPLAARGHAVPDEQIDDEELERSLEALQVVFARDQEVEEASLDWPEPEPPSDPAAFYEPASLQQPSVAEPDAAYEPLALEEGPEYELLLEDAIEEDEGVEESVAEPARDMWLPKLIEDEP